MRIIFMGTGEIALPTLQWLISHQRDDDAGGHEVVAVYTQPDKPVGRKQLLTAPEIKVIALERGIPVRQPETLRGNEEAISEFAAFRPDLAVVMAYGQILPRAVIGAPALACVNLHASLLPRHRGASPIQAAIRDGDSETGITLMYVVPKLDAGDMILKESMAIHPDDTGGTLHDRLAALGPRIIERAMPLFKEGRSAADPQEESLVTYSGKLGREDGEIDWDNDAAAIERLIRAYDPWPGTFSVAIEGGREKRLKIFPPVAVLQQTGSPGQVSSADGHLVVGCGSGSILLETVQPEGGKRMSAADYLRGRKPTAFEL